MEDSLPLWHFAIVWGFWMACTVGFIIWAESQWGDY